MMSCLRQPHAMQTIMTWCSYNANTNDVMPPQSYVADRILRKITAAHFKALITQNANENMPDMFLIVYLNENLRYCNEN